MKIRLIWFLTWPDHIGLYMKNSTCVNYLERWIKLDIKPVFLLCFLTVESNRQLVWFWFWFYYCWDCRISLAEKWLFLRHQIDHENRSIKLCRNGGRLPDDDNTQNIGLISNLTLVISQQETIIYFQSYTNFMPLGLLYSRTFSATARHKSGLQTAFCIRDGRIYRANVWKTTWYQWQKRHTV